MTRFNFVIKGCIEVADGAYCSEKRLDALFLADGTTLSLDVVLEPASLIDEQDIAYALEHQVFITPDTPLPALVAEPCCVDHPLGLPEVSLFCEMVELIKKDAPSSLLYDLTFGDDKDPSLVFTESNVDPLYTHDDVEQIEERYQRMIKAVEAFIARGFIIKELQFIGIKDSQGTKLRYVTPQGRLHTQEYIRSNGPEAMIPDDFLHDLEHIPRRP